MLSTMKRAAAVGDSPNRITLLRDADGDGVAEVRETFLDGLNQPFGMALLGDTFYVGNTDGVVAFPYKPGETRIARQGPQAQRLQAGRTLDAQPAVEPRRAETLCRRRLAHQYRRRRHGGGGRPRGHPRARPRERQDPHLRLAACATRSAWRGSRPPGRCGRWSTSATALGDETPPDYLTSVRDGGFYGWPYCYWDRIVDDRVPQDPAHGRNGDHPGLRARRPHRLARPVLASGRHPARLPGRHGDRPARLLEPQHAERLQGHLRALRRRPPVRAAARHPDRLPVRPTSGPPTAGRSASPSARTARCWWPTMSAT